MGKKKRLQKDAESLILSRLARYGPSHMYPFHEIKSKLYVGSRMTVHRAKDNLLKRFIELKEVKAHAGRDKKIYRLTYHGLLQALKVGALTPKEAKEARLRNDIQLPTAQFLPELNVLTPLMEKEAPEMFYYWFSRGAVDLCVVSDEILATATMLIALLTLITVGDIKKRLRGKDLVLKNGVVLEDFTTWLPSLLGFAKQILPKDMQILVDQRFKEMKTF